MYQRAGTIFCKQIILGQLWGPKLYPGEMVNGSSRMFANFHNVKTTHPIYCGVPAPPCVKCQLFQ